jgi:Fic family protein
VEYHRDGFPPSDPDWAVLVPHLGPAAMAVARFDGTLAALPNPAVLLSPITTQEAVLSSKIEGTQATFGDVLEFEAEETPEDMPAERRQDINEILNYRRAMAMAEDLLASLPPSLRVIRRVHGVLMDGVRGRHRSPGRFRTVPNWIGPPGSPVEEARFVPIPAERLQDGLKKWEAFIHSEAPDRLVQVAVLHAEFEALHPFLDGNGRVGRILIPLLMWHYGLIRRPMFYVSAYLERHRDEYYERLLAISRDGDWTGWCRFFLEGVKEQADEHLGKAQGILALYERLKPEVLELTRSQYAVPVLDWVFSRPLFKSTQLIKGSSIPEPTARRLLVSLKEGGILQELRPARGRRPALFAFPALLDLAEGRTHA